MQCSTALRGRKNELNISSNKSQSFNILYNITKYLSIYIFLFEIISLMVFTLKFIVNFTYISFYARCIKVLSNDNQLFERKLISYALFWLTIASYMYCNHPTPDQFLD